MKWIVAIMLLLSILGCGGRWKRAIVVRCEECASEEVTSVVPMMTGSTTMFVPIFTRYPAYSHVTVKDSLGKQYTIDLESGSCAFLLPGRTITR